MGPPKRHGQRAVEAVRGCTFGVRTGEVFGLLGANGAGKTTTMSAVMRAVEPTSGDVAISGTSVLSSFAQASEHLAVVNQHNTLWDALSCADHLRLFARLRMLESEVEEAVAATLARVELLNHADKPAGRLSGGMKRKLCGACALIGDPQIVLLDEPSAGLDPVSQRNLWNLIKATMAGRAVVLTTHSMVEADFLCDRIGIMVQGQLRCLGTSDHLKQRYASGYELVVKIEDDALEGVSQFVKERFGATLAAADAGTLTYELSNTSEKSADLLADAFQAFDESTRQSLKVAEFSVVQASLEKVFIRIVSGEGGEHEARDAHNRSVQVAQASEMIPTTTSTIFSSANGPAASARTSRTAYSASTTVRAAAPCAATCSCPSSGRRGSSGSILVPLPYCSTCSPPSRTAWGGAASRSRRWRTSSLCTYLVV